MEALKERSEESKGQKKGGVGGKERLGGEGHVTDPRPVGISYPHFNRTSNRQLTAYSAEATYSVGNFPPSTMKRTT